MVATATGSLAPRAGADNCPGALDLHDAADGLLARVRIPGGLLTAATLAGLGDLATRCAAGSLDVTARGNVQLRGVHAPTALTVGLEDLGLLPSVAHDRARNFGISPLTGLGITGAVDAVPVLAELDALVTADDALAALPGRFLMAVDDGSRTAPDADLTLAWADGGWQLLLAGHDSGPATPHDVITAADTFLRERSGDHTCWRVRELPGGADRLAEALGRVAGPRLTTSTGRLTTGPLQGGSVIVVAAWLQRLTPDQINALVAATAPSGLLRLATAGRIVLPTQSPSALQSPNALQSLRSAGLIVDAADRRGHLTACSGLGACARATVDVRSHAAQLEAFEPLHLVACPRGCGRPDDARLEVARLEVAT